MAIWLDGRDDASAIQVRSCLSAPLFTLARIPANKGFEVARMNVAELAEIDQSKLIAMLRTKAQSYRSKRLRAFFELRSLLH